MSVKKNVTANYEKSIVKVTANDDQIETGTGFIVTDDGIVCTCYHVIGDIISKKVYDDIKVYFTSGKSPLSAHVLKDEKGQEYADPINDIAFLQVCDKSISQPELESPTKEQELFVSPLSESIDFNDHPFIAKGYRKNDEFPQGLGSAGKIQTLTTYVIPEYTKEISIVQLYVTDVQEGMSGSPVLDTKTNKVIGMITRYYGKKEDKDENLVMAIPIKSLTKVYSQLSKKNPEPFRGC